MCHPLGFLVFVTASVALLRAAAKAAHEDYLDPVDSQVSAPTGELLDPLCANDRTVTRLLATWSS